MNKTELETLFFKAVKERMDLGQDIERISQCKVLFECYVRMFGELPHFVSTEIEGFYKGLEEEPYDYINVHKSLVAVENYLQDRCFVLRNFESKVIIADHLLIASDDDSLYGCCNQDSFPQEILDCLVKEGKEDKKYMSYVTSGGNGFNITKMEVKHQECDTTTNYNDDLPLERIQDFIEGDESGLIIMYGIPGTGNFIKICA